jgi:hypothetical protein
VTHQSADASINFQYDDIIRTMGEHHKKAVVALWNNLEERGQIYFDSCSKQSSVMWSNKKGKETDWSQLYFIFDLHFMEFTVINNFIINLFRYKLVTTIGMTLTSLIATVGTNVICGVKL